MKFEVGSHWNSESSAQLRAEASHLFMRWQLWPLGVKKSRGWPLIRIPNTCFFASNTGLPEFPPNESRFTSNVFLSETPWIFATPENFAGKPVGWPIANTGSPCDARVVRSVKGALPSTFLSSSMIAKS